MTTSTDIALPGDPAEVATVEQSTPAATLPAVPREYASEFLMWMEEARQAAVFATAMAKTSFVPASLRGKPGDITAALLAGKELGMRPITSLRSMDIIQGTPALRAHAMRALAQSNGHKIWLVEQGPSKVVMRGQRREADGSYGPVQESVWDIPRAALLGLTGKEQWKKQPQTMLTARATGEICRLVASDALHAMPYAVEELGDPDTVEASEPAMQRVTAAEILADAVPVVSAAPAVGAVDPAVARLNEILIGLDKLSGDALVAAVRALPEYAGDIRVEGASEGHQVVGFRMKDGTEVVGEPGEWAVARADAGDGA